MINVFRWKKTTSIHSDLNAWLFDLFLAYLNKNKAGILHLYQNMFIRWFGLNGVLNLSYICKIFSLYYQLYEKQKLGIFTFKVTYACKRIKHLNVHQSLKKLVMIETIQLAWWSLLSKCLKNGWHFKYN